MHGDTRNNLLALLVLYIPSGISKQVWFICYKSAMEVVYTLACIGSKQFWHKLSCLIHSLVGISDGSEAPCMEILAIVC